MATTTKPTVTVTPVQGDTALHCHYHGENSPQKCYLHLNLEAGVLSCGYDPHIGGGMTDSEFHRRTLTITIPCLTADEANNLMAKVAPIAQRVLDGGSIDWDGNDWVGYLSPAGQTAYEQLAAAVEQYAAAADTVDSLDAADWFGQGENPSEEYGITADTTDEELAKLEPRVEEDVQRDAQGVVVVRGLTWYLTELRDELRNARG